MTQDKIKVISINAENHKHSDRIIPFIMQEQPDILLMQEVYLDNVELYESRLNMKGHFAAHCTKLFEGELMPWGIATFTAHPVQKTQSDYYIGSEQEVAQFNPEHPEDQVKALLEVTINVENTSYTFLNTHFTWTPKGVPTDQQRSDIVKLMTALEKYNEFVFLADLNAPRGDEIFDVIARKYKDNIPAHITTTIDKNFHKAGDLQYVVDCLFTTPHYTAENVRIVDGLSDHCAIVADITKI